MVSLEVKTVRAVCPHDCPDTCGMVVTVRDGKAIDLRGDKEHPFTRGFLCQKVARYLDRTYHADRLKYPLKRVGPKGRGHFQRISWDEAVATITERFREIATLDPRSLDSLRAEVADLAKSRDDLNAGSPQIPRWAFEAGRRSLKAGEADYEVDKEPEPRRRVAPER